MERVKVIETSSTAWKAVILTIELYPHMEVLMGIEPIPMVLQTICSAMSFRTRLMKKG